jgi:hypothetical protein
VLTSRYAGRLKSARAWPHAGRRRWTAHGFRLAR